MLSLNDRKWGEFLLKDLFDVSGTITTPPKNLRFNGKTPRITCSSSNNGIDDFYGNIATEKGNVLTVDSATIGYISYQYKNFIATDHVEKLSSNYKNFNKLIALFIKKCIEFSSINKYHYGYKFSQKRIEKQKIILPINFKNEPDYDFMEKFIKQKEEKKKKTYLSYANERLKELTYKEIPSLDDKEWKEFFVSDIFNVMRPKSRSEKTYLKGNIHFVASGNFNNGVIRLCKATSNDVLDKKNCISVSPIDGSSFYQRENFLGRGGAGSSILLLYNDNMNEYSGLFLSKLIKQTCSKYNYGKMGNQNNIKREKIILPINSKNGPDYEYMEQYTKNLMYKKLSYFIQWVKKENTSIEIKVP